MKRRRTVAEPYVDDLYKRLKDPSYAAEFLNASLELAKDDDDPRAVLLALYDVAQARGMKKIADAANMHRVSLHRMLTKNGNPEWKSLFRVLMATQLRFRFESTLKKAA